MDLARPTKGLVRRVGAFLKSLGHALLGSSFEEDSDAKSGAKVGKKGPEAKAGAAAGSKSTAGASSTSQAHLDAAYRPGNVNYRIQKELRDFMANPPDNCRVSIGKNIRVWIITIRGADGTVYAGEKFRLRVAFPAEYPSKPPSVYFLQEPRPPLHPHIYTNGDICLSLLGRDWKPNLTVSSLALSILSMLSSAKDRRVPQDNAAHAGMKPGQAQDNWMYHDDAC
ncbi:unnamed protein product [Phaeothamnion confervicola]